MLYKCIREKGSVYVWIGIVIKEQDLGLGFPYVLQLLAINRDTVCTSLDHYSDWYYTFWYEYPHVHLVHTALYIHLVTLYSAINTNRVIGF